MPACRCGSSTVTTRRPLGSSVLWRGSLMKGPRRIRAPSGRRNRARLDRVLHRRQRQAQPEAGPLTDDALAGELPAVLLGDLLRHGEAKAGPPLLGGEEGVEDAL